MSPALTVLLSVSVSVPLPVPVFVSAGFGAGRVGWDIVPDVIKDTETQSEVSL